MQHITWARWSRVFYLLRRLHLCSVWLHASFIVCILNCHVVIQLVLTEASWIHVDLIYFNMKCKNTHKVAPLHLIDSEVFILIIFKQIVLVIPQLNLVFTCWRAA